MKPITIEAVVNAPIETVWDMWTLPDHITKWSFASNDWESPHAENNLAVGGEFLTRMSAKDGSHSFDFTGTYTEVEPKKLIRYSMSDGRTVLISFEDLGGSVRIIEVFDPESENPEEMQRAGWQAILDNFKALAEGAI